MDPSDANKLITIFIFILLAGYFSAAEKALTTVNKVRIRSLADDSVRGSKILLKLIEEPSYMYCSLSIVNTSIKISASALAVIMADSLWGSRWIALTVCVLTILFLLFSDITAQSISQKYPEKIALAVSGPVLILTYVLKPISFLLNRICHGILLLLQMDPSAKSGGITEDELRTLLDVSHAEGIIESEERRMITNVVDFGDSLAKDVMVPRIDMAFASASLTYDELVQIFSEDKYTRMPVFSESRDNVIGIVNLKDVFFYQGDKDSFQITDIIRDPYFTYEFKKTSELLMEMRKDSIPIAIVLDEYGATAGLITIEDLLEEIVGEIRDEYDYDEEDSIKFLSENEYIVDGNTKLDDINEALGLNLEAGDYDSIAGHVIYLLDHLPEEGESVTIQNTVLTVAAVDKNRIDKVHILLIHDEDQKNEE